VCALAHPDVRLVPINVAPAVAQMVGRARHAAGEARPGY
jgi:hypothetical protein